MIFKNSQNLTFAENLKRFMDWFEIQNVIESKNKNINDGPGKEQFQNGQNRQSLNKYVSNWILKLAEVKNIQKERKLIY